MTLDADIHARRGAFVLDAQLRAASGDVVAVVGRNGSGKSTLLRALAGLQPATGRVHIDGTDVSRLPSHARAVGWVPQDGALFPHLTALDNVAFGCGGRHGRDEAQAWLDRVGVGALAGRRPAQLSGGQAQKVALARALARRPRLLLLDEPLAALDTAARVDLRATLSWHLDDFDGVTLLVTHDSRDADTLCSRLIRLDDGRLAASETS
jgi:ABC-type sulfate/molybdate transport systems ATPase subunit